MSINLICTIVCLLLANTLQKINFEKNIFVYWQTNMNQAPLLVKVSHQKLSIAAKNAGWTLHLINGTNIKDFLPNYDHFVDVVARGHRKTVQQKSDILRVHLIEQHGGVWFDFVPILYQNLNWLTDNSIIDKLIINRVGSSKDDPDMLMIGQGWHQSPYSYYNSQNSLVCEQYFGNAIHFVAAKRKSAIITAWKQKFDKMVTMRLQDMMPDFLQKRIYLKNIDNEDVYLSGNMAYEQTIQQKQFELDDQMNIFSGRQNVYEHFKIWQIHGEVGPIVLTRSADVVVPDLFIKTKQEVQEKSGKLWLYLKIPRWARNNIQDRQSRAENYFRQNPNLDVQTILKNKPTNQQCQLFFIVKGSILHTLYENSTYKSDIKTPFITIKQRQQFHKFCSQINTELYTPQYTYSVVAQMTKVQRQVKYTNATSLAEKLAQFKNVYKLEIQNCFQKWKIAFRAICIYLVVRNLLLLLKAIFVFVRNKFIRRRTHPISLQETFKKYFNESYLKRIIINNLTVARFMYFLRWIMLNTWGFTLLFAKSVMFALTYQFFDDVAEDERLGQWGNLVFILGLNLCLDAVINKFISKKSVNTFLNLETVLKETRVFIYLPLGHVAILHMDIVYGFAYFHTMNIVGGGLLLYAWIEQIKARKIGFVFLDKLEAILSNAKWAIFGLLLVYTLSKSVRYMRYPQHYVKEYIVDMVNFAFWGALLASTVMGLAFLVYNLWLFYTSSIQQEREINKANLSETDTQKKTLRKSYIYHSLLMLVIMLMVIYRTDAIYSSKLSYPYGFPYLQLFRIILPLYALCAALIRLTTSTGMFTIYGSLVSYLSLLPLMYSYYGMDFYQWISRKEQVKGYCFTLLVVVFAVIQVLRASSDTTNNQPKSIRIETNDSPKELVEENLSQQTQKKGFKYVESQQAFSDSLQ